MPRAWYFYGGTQISSEFDKLSNYELLLFGEPACDSGNRICAVYAIGNRLLGIQSNRPTNISFVRSFYGDAISNGASMPLIGGNNAQGLPYYVRVIP